MGNYSIRGLSQMAPENEVASVLSRFNSQYVYDVIQDKMMSRFDIANFATVQNANIVQSFNQNFKDIVARYPSDVDNVLSVETQTYVEIINLICASYNIEPPAFDPSDTSRKDYYFAVAFYLYDFLVSGFFDHLCEFFARYIYTNKDALYEALGLDAYRKNKDSSTIYGKGVFKDIKTIVISANIMMVVNNMTSFDVTANNILTTIYGNPSIVNMLDNIISHFIGGPDFYRSVYCNVPQQSMALMYTNIRLKLQQFSTADGEIESKLF